MQDLGIYGPLVLADIARVRPKVICALGKSAAALFGVVMPIGQARGRRFQFEGFPVRVTYHPAFVLRFGGKSSRLWKSTVSDVSRFWREAREGQSSSRPGDESIVAARARSPHIDPHQHARPGER